MTELDRHRVGVVIPTFGRPGLVLRAVKSVLAQTYSDLELVVVVDGQDDETVAILSGIVDARLRVDVQSKRGACAARNRGVSLLTTPWVAFLDDDDLWLPRKLEVQLALAVSMGVAYPIVSCRSLNISRQGKRTYPLRMPMSGEPASEFLFAPKGYLARRGGVQTPTILTLRSLLERVPFDESLPRHQDWDWLLRAVQIVGVELRVAPEILVEVDQYSAPQRISGSREWRYSFDWIRARQGLVSKRAYAGFLLTVIPTNAARGGATAADFMSLLRESWRGAPGPVQLSIFLAWWVMPDRFIRWAGRVASQFK